MAHSTKDKDLGFTTTSSSSSSSISDTRSPPSAAAAQTKRSSQAGWTDEQDAILTHVVKKYNARNWKKIAESIPGRSDVQCLHRWQKVLNPQLVKGPWTKQEDDRIRQLVEKYGCKKWSLIAKHLSGRIGKQCRERWHNHLDPAIKKDAWTDEEESTLAYYHQIYGNKWAEIARFLPGRTDNAIKNHWNSTKRRLDLNMPFALSATTTTPELSVVKKRNRETSLMEHNAKLSTQTNTCSTNLALGNTTSGITYDDCLGFARYAKFHKAQPSTSPDLKLGTSPDNSFLSLSILGFSEDTTQTTEKHLVYETPPNRSVCYQPPKFKNLTKCLENGGCGSPGTINSSRSRESLNGQISCSTPPDLALSISINSSSPESILRNSGLSYKNTPSIIRKRTPRKIVVGYDCSKNGETSELETEKCDSDSWLHRSQPSFGRRLDYMFDAECYLTKVRCCTQDSVTPSSKANVMLSP